MNTSITASEHRNNVGVIVSDPQPLPEGARALRPTLLTAGRSRYEEYREHAAECQEIANHWSDLIKHQYEELARQWLMLAKRSKGHSSYFPA
jgi:hypothetical protein